MGARKGWITVVVLCLLAVVISGCKGDRGPAGPQGEPGPPGPQGDPGPTGEPAAIPESAGGGLAGYERLTRTFTVKRTDEGGEGFFMVCPAGKNVLSGGYEASSPDITVFASKPLDDRRWIFRVRSEADSAELDAFVICATVQ